MSTTLNCFLLYCLAPFYLALFLEFCLVVSFRKYPFFSSLCLTLCVCFYVLDQLSIPAYEAWHYVEGFCTAQWHSSQQSHLLLRFSSFGLCSFSYCGWATVAVGTLAGGAGTRPGLAVTAADVLWVGLTPKGGLLWKHYWCWPRCPTRSFGVTAALEGQWCSSCHLFGVAVMEWLLRGLLILRGMLGWKYALSARLIESNRNGAHQLWAS